ncbi:hypothetical protein BS47DRAFT_1384214 [Hydnum rufescens UP504]|uniref:Aspartyl/Glutamyl-tRNA(Gln) amidotransferase subunit B/E catalytic domain-containing protein n=1 Tax=Hydnum rufescens UP504 TaxID=1448309 RepID=A0A9P6AS48_9AGAM|nr:hypothetical protein BS47DRAFT_1384214 [Hydnum rufescens UP504]
MGSDVQKRCTFDRKHYFYPDLPSGYQITQKYGTVNYLGPTLLFRPDSWLILAPLATGGQVLVGQGRAVSIEQIQLEQDIAKSTKSITGRVTHSCAVTEIVSRPDMRFEYAPFGGTHVPELLNSRDS